MLNVVNKVIASLVLSCLTLITSCTSGVNDGDKHNSADSIYAKVENAMSNCQYQKALLLIDSIDSSFPQAIDVRRKAMKIRPRVIEELAKQEYSLADSMIVILQHRHDSMLTAFSKGTVTATQCAEAAKELRSWQNKMKKINHKLTVARNQQARLNDTLSR